MVKRQIQTTRLRNGAYPWVKYLNWVSGCPIIAAVLENISAPKPEIPVNMATNM
jgi:hypothetical protein